MPANRSHEGQGHVIQIEAVSFRYPGATRDAIRGLSLQIRPGSLFGLLGPNGSGKTTLISLLTGLLRLQQGQIRIDGRALPTQTGALQNGSALVPQEYAFYPRLTVMENLRFFGSVLGLRAVDGRERLNAALVAAGLVAFVSVRAGHLSGGLKRRLNLAIGLLNRPRLLLLDEPTVGIDPQSRHFILDTIREINARGTTVIYTSHYMQEVESLCDEIGVLDDGCLLAQGSLEQLLNRDADHDLRLTLGAPPSAAQQAALSSMPALEIADRELRLPNCNAATLQHLLAWLAANGLRVNRINYGYGNLEELFLHLTGRQLRD